jgi:hypothetical protein
MSSAWDAEGFEPGAPPRITLPTLAIDTQIARASRCQVCRRRGLSLLPYHDGQGVYRAVARCDCCGDETEM